MKMTQNIEAGMSQRVV